MPLMLPSKNKIATIIVDKMSGPKPKGEEIEANAQSTSDYDMALESACEDILSAIETKNLKLLLGAMKDFHSIYDEEMEAQGYGTEEEETEREGE